MIKFLLALTLFSSQSFAALPPTTAAGQSQTGKPTTFNFQVPFNQATVTASSTALFETGNTNVLVNAGFEHSTVATGYTVAGTPTADTTTQFLGKKAIVLPTIASAGDMLAQDFANCSQFSGNDMEAAIYLKTTAAQAQVCSVVGGTEYQCVAADTSGTWKKHVLNFPAPSTGACGIKVKSTAATSVTVSADSAYLGLARNIRSLAQADFVGSAKWVSAGNCSWSRSATSYGAYVADADCVTPTGSSLQGSAIAPATKIPAVSFASLPAGRYQIRATGKFIKGGTTTSNASCWRFSDGTNVTGSNCAASANTVVSGIGSVIGDISYTAGQSNVTIELQGLTDGAAEPSIISADANSTSIDGLTISLYRFPTTSQQAITADDNAWYLDFNINGGNVNLGTSTVAAYSEMTNASLSLVPRSGSAPVGVTCSGTNAAAAPSTSTTNCAAGSESVGFNTNIPRSGAYEVCAYFSKFSNIQANGNDGTAFQLIETPTNAQTILTEGGTKTSTQLSGTSQTVTNIPFSSCSIFNFSSSGTKAIRLMYEQFGTLINDSLVLADLEASDGQRDIRMTMRPWTGNQPAPLLIGSVVYNDAVQAGGAAGVTSIAKVTGSGSAAGGATNITGIGTLNSFGIRVSDYVELTVATTVQAAAAGTYSFEFAPPIASNFTTTSDALGTCTSNAGNGYARVTANTTTKNFAVNGSATGTATAGTTCKIWYVIK